MKEKSLPRFHFGGKKLIKLQRIMRLTLLLMTVAIFQVHASVYSQTEVFSFKETKTTMRGVFKTIEKQSKFRFFYNDLLANVDKVVDLNVKNMKMDQVLEQLFVGTNLSFKILENNLVIVSTKALLQQSKITGVVTSGKDKQPIPGVTIRVKGTTTGTISDLDGKFTIDVPNGDAVLVFTFIGYKTSEVVVGNQKEIKVELAEDSKALDEVVVVGYGVKKKSLLTGATSSVSAADVSSSIGRAEQALQGKAAGVSVTTNSGSPGNGMKVTIRGAGSNGKSDPLYIVDGMKTSDINFLDPSDIESMEVLKDAASSAIYGTEGANGVVIIKTKSGAKGPSKIEYSFQQGFQSLGHKPKMMNALQYSTYMLESAGYIAAAANKPLDYSGPKPTALDSEAGTDWMSEIAEVTPMQSHHLAFSGATEKGSYMLSGGYSTQNGIIGGSKASFERITTRLNVNQQLRTWLEVGANMAYTYSTRSSVTEDDGFNGIVNSALLMDPTGKARYAPSEITPYMKGLLNDNKVLAKDGDGNYYGLSNNNFLKGEIINPLIRIANEKGITTDSKVVTSHFIKVTPMEGLSVTSRIGMDLDFQNFNSWNPSYYGNSNLSSNAPSVTINDNKYMTWLFENFASYTKKLDLHNFTAMVGISAQEYTHTSLNTSSGLMIREDDQYRYPNYVSSRKNDVIGGIKERTTMSSTFGRLSYDYNNKYMLEGTLRRDGSSLFGSNNRYGIFPSFSAGWTISQESFWSSSALSFVKLRGSWGQNGSLSNLGPDQYALLISTTGVRYPDASGNIITGAEPSNLPNPDLRWETSEQTDLGLDIRALNGKVYFTFDAYLKKTKDLLTSATPPLSLGNYIPLANAGEVTNKGMEFLLGYQDKASEFTYDINFNMSLLKNEVTGMNSQVERVNGASLPTLGVLTYMEKGQPIYYYRGYKTDGINPANGEVIIKDVSGDGKIDDKDLTNIGSPHPDVLLGTNINLSYKNFDLNIFGQGAFGQENYIGFARADNGEVNMLEKFYTNRWTSTNTSASMPRAGYKNEKFYKSDLMVEDGSYFKIRQIQLGYNLPKNVCTIAKVSKARVYISLNDYFTFTKYSGMDPEVGSRNNNAQGIDFGIYPVSKKFLFGCSLTF